MRHFCTILVFLLVCSISFSQQEENPTATLISPTPLNYIVTDGTYQVILSDHRMVEPELTDAVLHEINDLRDAEELKYIQLGEYITIKILPFSIINAEDFIPLEKYIYEN